MFPEDTNSNSARLLCHLPAPAEDWKQRLAAGGWEELLHVAKMRLDFLACAKVDRKLTELLQTGEAPAELTRMRLAVLASSTTHHLIASLRVAALRRNIVLDVHECGYGQYMQELAADGSALEEFAPQVILFALDAHHLTDLAASGVEPLDRMRDAWHLARDRFGATIIQQTALPVFPSLLGSNEHRFPATPAAKIAQLNRDLRTVADEENVSLLSIDTAAAREGLVAWHDPAMWFRAKQEVHPMAAPLYAETLAPLLAAIAGRTYKCLVLDLDNTLWGGVIGDDGMEGILLGQGHAAGEAFLEFQRYCLTLRERGVLLAVCSKNDEAIALTACVEHPAMLLRRKHFAAFVANWHDKATNLRAIAKQLNIGTDALVFADDNPFERELVRREMPEVAVPELSEDPAYFSAAIARGGYFEQTSLTGDDLQRAQQYQANVAREEVRAACTDLEGYLRSLKMVMRHRPFDEANLTRIVQLIGKTNQFNLTTRRYCIEEVRAMMSDPCCMTWQIGLVDSFGDNGTIAAVIARAANSHEMRIDTWLMSCRVLGRRVEEATLVLLVEAARSRGIVRIIGEYIPTAKNIVVRDLYARLGFVLSAQKEDGSQLFTLNVESYEPPVLPIEVVIA